MGNDVTLDQSSFQPLQSSTTTPPASPAGNPQAPPVSLDSNSFTPISSATNPDAGLIGSVIGPNTALGAKLSDNQQQEASGVSDILHGNLRQGFGKIYDQEIGNLHIIQGSPIEKIIQKFNPEFKGGIAPTDAEAQNHANRAGLENPTVDIAANIDKTKNPVWKAVAEASQSLTSPSSVATMIATGGMGLVESPKALGMANKLLSAGFSANAIGQAYTHFKDFKDAYDKGDSSEALYQLTHSVLSGAMAYVAGSHAGENVIPGVKSVAGSPSGSLVTKGADLLDKTGLPDAARQLVKDYTPNLEASADKVKAAKIANDDTISARKDIKMAIPSTKSTPYEPHDMDVADAYNESHHENVEPIRGVKDLVDATDQSIKGIENQIAEHIKIIPNEPITTDVLSDVRSKLMENERGAEFANAGMKEIKGLNLDNITVERADSVRRQLNAENSAILKKNNYDLADARASDPGFAAREAAAESLRTGIYDQLENHNIQGARELRLDEGSLIKVRDAAQAQLQNAEKIVKNSSPASLTRQILAKTAKGAGALVGAGTGAVVAGPVGAVGGAATGGALGEIAANKIASPDISRDELVERRFGKKVATYEPAQMSVPGGITAPPEKQAAIGTQGTLPESTKTPVAAPGTVEQGKLFGTESPYPRYAAQQSPQAELLSLRQSIAPLKAILDDPTASQVDKVDAAQKLAALPLAELQNPTVKSAGSEARGASKIELPYETPKEKPLEIPSKELDTNQILGHEWGHALVAHKEGFGVDEIRSHLNPDLVVQSGGGKVNASTVIDLKNLGVGPDGQIPQSNFNAAIDRILTTVMGGAASDFVHYGMPMEDNPGLLGDLAYSRRILKKAGYTPEEAEAKIDAAFNRARDHLTNQHAIDIMKENRDVRESGLSKTLHVSSDRMREVLNELDRRQNEGNNRGLKANNGEHDQHNVPGRKGNVEEESRQQVANETGGKQVNVPPERSTGKPEIDAAIKNGGAVPGGIQIGDPEIGVPDLAYFHDPKSGSTLAYPVDKITPEAIQNELSKSRKAFGIKE